MSEDTNPVPHMVMVEVDCTIKFNMMEGMKLPFTVEAFRVTRGDITCNESPEVTFEGTLELVVRVEFLIPLINHFGGQVKVDNVVTFPTTPPFAVEEGTNTDAERAALWKKLDEKVLDIFPDKRYQRPLGALEIVYFGDVVQKHAQDMKPGQCSNWGKNAQSKLVHAMQVRELTFGMDTMGWEPPPRE